MTLHELCADSRRRLETKFPSGEAQAMVREIMLRLKGYSPVDLVVKGSDEVSDFIKDKTAGIIDRLLKDEPLQYILGHAWFYGMDFEVTPDVLIPRPETAELIDLIVDRYRSQSDLSVLDVCTGSGCIAIALARNLSFSDVEAIDISQAALAVAQSNNSQLKTKVKFRQADALKLPEEREPKYDIIVSNPPYITLAEKKDMEANVIDHEPHLALFVPDNDPLEFYHAIAKYAATALKNGGTLWFELNPLFADTLADELRRDEWEDVELHRDTSAKNRFLSAVHR